MKKKIYSLSLIFFLLDQISKIIVLNIKKEMPITIISNFFYIDRVTNEGAAFSILNGFTIVFIIIGIIALIYINKYLLKDLTKKTEVLSFSMLIGGILGNLFDRIVYGKVIDFLSFKFFSYNFPVFNLADSFICIGVLIIIILEIGGKNGSSSK